MFAQQNYLSQYEQYEFPQFKFKMDPQKVLDHKIWIENIPIVFPQRPYDVQQQYMKSVIQALNSQSNALLQSPTGTGKTLALLCATLAWVNAGNRKTKIIYASRTHSQLQQVAKELKKVAYQPNVCMLGSRNLLCINKKLTSEFQGADLNNRCNKLVRREEEEGCPYYSKENIEIVAQDLQNQIMDIEDFKTYCRMKEACPFYVERERMKNADIILLPYNYLLQMQLKNYIDVSNSIIIFDEAHNVVKAAEDGYSFHLSQQTIINGINKLEKWIDKMEKLSPADQNYQDPTYFINVSSTMRIFSNHLDGLLSTYCFVNNETYCLAYNGRLILKILSHYFTQSNQNFNFFLQLTQDYRLANEDVTLEELEIVYEYCSVTKKEIENCQNHPGPKIKGLLKFTDSIIKLFDERQTIDSYKLFIEKQGDDQITLSMVCLDPSIAFNNFFQKSVYSIIITSGTLTPFHSWSKELNVDFNIELDNGHLPNISYNVKGFLIKQFNFSYIERNDEQQIKNLGQMILKLCDVIPNGILLVFSSYQLMNMIKFSWANLRILECLSNKKDLFFEPQTSSNLKQVFREYQEKSKMKGAILFCVQRGKVSEGIDFSDELCRAVFLIGVPNLAIQDNRVQEKMKFIDKQKSQLTGNEWYAQQAIRSANQALGRVIRHKNDYGAVFLCDSRYQIGQLSKWVQPAIQTVQCLNDQHYSDIESFFKIKGNMNNQMNYY